MNIIKDKSPTLRSQMKHHEPIVLLDMTHANDVVRMSDDGICPTLQHRMGTGGNQVPMVFIPTANFCGEYKEGEVSATIETSYHYGPGGCSVDRTGSN